MGAPQRYSDGVTNIGPSKTLSEMPMLDPTVAYGYFNDFFVWADADWVVTSINGPGTRVVSDALAGGVVVITTDTADNDADWFQLSDDGGTDDSEVFLFATGKKAWFKCRFKITEITHCDCIIGLHIIDTTPDAGLTDGVYFVTVEDSEELDFIVRKGSSDSGVAGIHTLLDATFVTVGYYWDGIKTIHYFINDIETGSVGVGTSLPDDEYIPVSFGIKTGTTAAAVLHIDYIGAWMER